MFLNGKLIFFKLKFISALICLLYLTSFSTAYIHAPLSGHNTEWMARMDKSCKKKSKVSFFIENNKLIVNQSALTKDIRKAMCKAFDDYMLENSLVEK